MFKALLTSLLLLAPVCLMAHIDKEHARSEVTADQLKNWYDNNKPMVVIDARTRPYFDQTILPNAKWVPHDSSEIDLQAVIPTKSSTVVIYCGGAECPASGLLYDRLVDNGYVNIYEYRGGIKDWIRRDYPTVTYKQPQTIENTQY